MDAVKASVSETPADVQIDFEQDYFALFGLPLRFDLDESALQHAWHGLQVQVHPDRFAHLSEAHKRRSMQWATHINEAFSTLRKPVSRAVYLLGLAGVSCDLETNTAMSPAFLMEQMTWREAVADARQARDGRALEAVHAELNQTVRGMLGLLAQDFEKKEYSLAADRVRQLMFVEKLQREVNDALEVLES